MSSHPQLRLIFRDRQLPMNSLSLLCLFTETAPTPAETSATVFHTLPREEVVLVKQHYRHTEVSEEKLSLL